MYDTKAGLSPRAEIDSALRLAWEHHRAGRAPEAEAGYRWVLEREPENADALNLFGVLALQMGQLEIAEELIADAIASNPGEAQYHVNLGVVYRQMGKLPEAIECYRQALLLRGDLAEAHTNLGAALLDQGALVEARESLERAVALAPESVEALVNLGNLLRATGAPRESIALYRRALQIAPGAAEAHNNLGSALKALGSLDEAVASFEQAIALRPRYVEAHTNLGGALRDRGQPDRAVECFEKALSLDPRFEPAHAAWANVLLYWPSLAERAAAEHQRWERLHARPLYDAVLPHGNVADPGRRLKVGYVSNDFRRHATAYFIEPVLASHDSQRFEVICYDNHGNPDAVTQRLMGSCAGWRNVAGLSDEALADLVRRDGVDILVDLGGHTARSRLLVFARKPAPVQATWIGYPYTTALQTMDYWIGDAVVADPEKMHQPHSEELVRLQDFFMCFRPDPDSPAVNDLPALETGHVTFGSFNAFLKVNPEVIALWARLLRETPDSRLVMVTVPEGWAQREVLARFSRHGIAAERIELAPRLSHEDFLALHHRVDVALDPFPYNGTTTSLHGLWMGVPIVTLEGETFAARVGASLLHNLGLPEFIAATPEEYVSIARRAAADLPRLRQLRMELRQRMAASPLVDAAGFTAHLEHAYRAMWEKYCGSRPHV